MVLIYLFDFLTFQYFMGDFIFKKHSTLCIFSEIHDFVCLSDVWDVKMPIYLILLQKSKVIQYIFDRGDE